MKSRKLYSIVISPPSEVLIQVDAHKNILADNIGWYHSRNAKAHITILELMANDNEISVVEKFMTAFCKLNSSFDIKFDGVRSYSNGAFFISPDKQSKIITKNFMRNLQNCFPLKADFKSSSPHMSIARKLNKQHVEIANFLFQNLTAAFHCDRIVLRKFNEDRQQFDDIQQYFLVKKSSKGDNNILMPMMSSAFGQLDFGF